MAKEEPWYVKAMEPILTWIPEGKVNMSRADDINKARELMKDAAIIFDRIRVDYQTENTFRVSLKIPKEQIAIDVSKDEMLEIANWVLNLFIDD